MIISNQLQNQTHNTLGLPAAESPRENKAEISWAAGGVGSEGLGPCRITLGLLGLQLYWGP